jgi:TldD protein
VEVRVQLPAIDWPAGVYSDVRFEEVASTTLRVRDGVRENVTTRAEVGAFLRVLHNGMWATASTTDLSDIGAQLRALVRAVPAGDGVDPRAQLVPHKATVTPFADRRADAVPLGDKLDRLETTLAALDRPSVQTWNATWVDTYRWRGFVSSAGAEVVSDGQLTGISVSFSVGEGARRFSDNWMVGADTVEGLDTNPEALAAAIAKAERFAAEAEPVEAGPATVILSPFTAGVFAHESFGHKSEADFMIGDPSMLEAWKLGSRVGSDVLSIVDDGTIPGTGYTPYDDEGQPAGKTWLVKNGVLTGRLHSASTASALGEGVTGNARAMSFRYEPIVRMTSTYIDAGTSTKAELFAGVEDGYFVESFRHGSGMSTFTIAPALAWRIRNGKIAEPVRISVISGTVFETLGLIDGVSDTVELMPTVTGGCGKLEQYPLPVAFGGPYVRIKRMMVA